MGIVRSQSIKNSISFYIGMFLGAINTVVIYPNVFSDTPEHLGLIQILVAYALVISAFTTLGMPKTFIRFFPSFKNKAQLFALALILPLFGFFFILLIYTLFKVQIFNYLEVNYLLRDNFFYILILIFFIGFYDILTAISRSFLNATTPIFINEVFLKAYSLCILIMHWYDFVDFNLLLKLYIAGYILKFIILFFIQIYFNRIKIEFFQKEIPYRKLFKFGVYVLAGGASIMLVTRMDMMMIGSILGLEEVAFYTIAFFIGNAIKVPGRSVVAISVSLIAKAWEKQNIKEIELLYKKSSINQLIVGGVFFLCIWINIDDVFLLLPDKFQNGKWVVFFIALSQLFNISSGINGAIIVNTKYYKYDLYTNLFLVLITIVSNYFLIHQFGINGAAMATAISIFLFNIMRLLIIYSKMKIHPFMLQTLYTIFILVFVYLIVQMLPNISNPFINIVYKSLIIVCVFTPLCYILNLSDDISEIIKKYILKYIS